MKTLYLECNMGAAGDMLTAALLELHSDPRDFLRRFAALGIPGVEMKAAPAVSCGITGTHVSVSVFGKEEESMDGHGHHHAHEHEHDHEHTHEHEHEHEHDHHHDHAHSHHHAGMGDIRGILERLPVSQKVRSDAVAVYELIAQAESRAHGRPVEEIHFHEVGTMDAIADVTAVCMLIEELSPDRILASPIHVGSGQVRCAHGILPVPAPATAHILQGVPIYGGTVRGELCTPTGAALLKHFVSSFGPSPVMRVEKIGYGMGKKEFEAANCVRALLGESDDQKGQVLELSCNVDDMTGEAVGFATRQLLEAGALDVYTVPIGMKKSRPGLLIRVMCPEEDREKMVQLIFRYTTTIGIREVKTRRYTLERSVTELETPYGTVRRKDSSGYGVIRSKYEYEDLVRIGLEKEISVSQAAALLDELKL